MQHVTTARDTPSLYVDVSDLLQYLQTHQHPTGIQRVHSEILRRIPGLPGGEAVHFVVLDETQQLQRIVPAALLEVLASLEEPGRAALDARLRALAGQVAPVSLGSGDVFLAIGAFWNVRGMGALFQRLKMAGALIGIYVHDLLSLTEPEYFNAIDRKLFVRGFLEAAGFADFALANSAYTRDAVQHFLAERSLPPLPSRVVTLAHETPAATLADAPVSAEIAAVLGTRYVLCVGTMEVRKNPPYLFNIWRLLVRSGRAELPSLVFAGRPGWLVHDVLGQLDSSDRLGGRIRLLPGVTDGELAALYRHCLLTMFPSFAEGWGLPVGESLAHGKICLASRETAIPEVGGTLADYIDPYNIRDGLAALTRYLDDPAARLRREQEIAQSFRPRLWQDVAQELLGAALALAARGERPDRAAAIRLPPGRFLPICSDARALTLSGMDGAFSADLACLSGWQPPEHWGIRAEGPVSTLRFCAEAAEGTRIHLVLRLVAGPMAGCRIRLVAETGGETLVALAAGGAAAGALSCRVGPGGLVALRAEAEGAVGGWGLRGFLYYPTAAPSAALPSQPIVPLPEPGYLRLDFTPPDPGPQAASLTAFFDTGPVGARWWPMAAAARCYDAPIFATRADSEIFHRRFYNGGLPRLGPVEERIRLVRRQDVHVSMARFSEGTVFDRAGLAKSAGYFNLPHTAAPWLRRAADHVTLDAAALDVAPILDGMVAVFFNGNLQNYYHWLIEGLVPLDILAQAAPDDQPLTLVLPKSMDIAACLDHRATLPALGFGSIRTVETAADLIRVRDAVWVEPDLVERMPALHLRRFRDRIAALHAARRGPRDKRLLVARRGPTRMIGNLAEVEAYLARHGFETVYLEGMAPLEQILLFQRAEFVVAPHGGGLANLAFCAAGTKIIELMPTAEMRPFFWLISEKLDLVHGVQFCAPAAGEGFQASLAVDIAKLDALYHMVDAHRGEEE